MTLKDREAKRDWDAFRLSVEKSTAVEIDEDPVLKRKRIDGLLADINLFAKYYFPHYCQAEFGKFHKRYFKRLLGSNRAYITNAWSRDHAKSVVVTVISTIYLKQIRDLRNLMLVSHNENNAQELLKPIMVELESNQRLINDFGVQKKLGDWESGKFTANDGCCFRAVGAGQSPRGARDNEARPDMIIVDDIDTEEVCRNPRRLDQLWEWVTGALYPCFSIQGKKRFIVNGNIIAKDCIVNRAIQLSDHHEQIDILTKQPIDEDYIRYWKEQLDVCESAGDKRALTECVKYAQMGYQPSWSERFTLFDCVYMICNMPYRMSQREYFNNPLVEGKVFKKEWMQFKKLPPLRQYIYLMAYLDPGFKKSATSDSKSQVLVALHNGEFHIRKVFCGKASVEEMIEWGYEMDGFVKRHNGAYRFKMEDVFLQDLLYKDYAEAGKKKGHTLPVSGDKRKKPDKDARIEAISGYFERGCVFFDEDIREEHHVQALIEQLLNFEPGVKTLKDGPDALEGCMHLLEQNRKLAKDATTHTFSHNSKHKI